jgi:hypothetical protein
MWWKYAFMAAACGDGPIREMSWESWTDELQSVANPNWSDVELQIRHLETAQSGSVFLKAANESTLSVAGDQGKGYIVFVEDANGCRTLKAAPTKRKGAINLVIGFQPAEYPCRIVVDLDAALKAARAYFDTGRIEDSEDRASDGQDRGNIATSGGRECRSTEPGGQRSRHRLDLDP